MIVLCLVCGRPIDPLYVYCPYCGKRQQHGDAWYHSPVWIAILALLVLGPFALGLVWNSRQMGRNTKIAFTACIGLYTLFLIYEVYWAVSITLGTFGDLDQLL